MAVHVVRRNGEFVIRNDAPPEVIVSRQAFEEFIDGVKAGEFDTIFEDEKTEVSK